MEGCKIFVGNVPFQCNQTEFTECFEKMPGFIKAEIVFKNDMTISRGFGFLTFDSQENAKKIIGNNTVVFKDRTLRFTEYSQNKVINIDQNHCNDTDIEDMLNQSNINLFANLQPITQLKTSDVSDDYKQDKNIIKKLDIKQKNLLIVKNIKPDLTRENLYEIFSQFGQVGRHFIVTDHDTGNKKSYAIVEIIDDVVYENLIRQKDVKHDDCTILEVSKWKIKQSGYCGNYSSSHTGNRLGNQCQNQNQLIKKRLFYNNDLFN